MKSMESNDVSPSACSPNCQTCSPFECLACRSPFLLQDGLCVRQCTAETHLQKGDTCASNAHAPVLAIRSQLLAVPKTRLLGLSPGLFHVSDPDTPADQLSLRLGEHVEEGEVVKVDAGAQRLF